MNAPIARTSIAPACHEVSAVRGTVVDVRGMPLPQLGHVLTVSAGERQIMLLVVQHVSEHTVRTIALQTSDGLARGMAVHDSGAH